jgi:hypothetical protein
MKRLEKTNKKLKCFQTVSTTLLDEQETFEDIFQPICQLEDRVDHARIT